MKIPSEIQCYRIMTEMVMLDNIAAHSIRVCQVATLLADSLNSTGFTFDPGLITAAALLHDITKTRSLKTAENHARTGGLYLRELGYPEVGEIVWQHIKISEFDPQGKPTEAEIVNYADKRVLHDKVVSLEKRIAYIMKRYTCSGQLGNQLGQMRQQSQVIENKLFKNIPFLAEELNAHLGPEDFKNDIAGFRQAVRGFSNTPAI